MQVAGQVYTRNSISATQGFLESWAAVVASDTAGYAELSVKDIATLTSDQQAKIREIRNSVAFPTNVTVFQKVVEDTSGYTNSNRGVGRFIAVAADVKNLTTLNMVVQGMRLDYANSPFLNESKADYAVIRFTLPNVANVRIPCKNCTADARYEPKTDSLPFVGTGFTASTLRVGGFPEYVIVGGYPLPNDGAEIYIVDARTGIERRVLVLRAGKWVNP
jgi:hypothetical protein